MISVCIAFPLKTTFVCRPSYTMLPRSQEAIFPCTAFHYSFLSCLYYILYGNDSSTVDANDSGDNLFSHVQAGLNVLFEMPLKCTAPSIPIL